MKDVKNKSASTRQRLFNLAKESYRPFQELLAYYAMERFLYRLSRSEHADRFILKGALMFKVWCASQLRPTMDIDLLGRTDNNETHMVKLIRSIILLPVEPDGLSFDADSIKTERITQDVDYEGIRVRFNAYLDTARITVQIDIGFGDVVYPGSVSFTLPAILGDPAAVLLGYSRESAIAEKVDAMIKHGALNSRMKDFFDIWMLSRDFSFEGHILAEAIRLTFEQRATHVTQDLEAFSERYIDSRQHHWTAFIKRIKLDQESLSFREVNGVVARFLSPVLVAVLNKKPFGAVWDAGGLWRRD